MQQSEVTTLFMSWRNTRDNQLLWQTAVARGWQVERIRGASIPEVSSGKKVLYIESLFAPTIANALGLRLLGVSKDWLPELPAEYRKRDVTLTTLDVAATMTFPLFLKPPEEKSFLAKVYEDAAQLIAEYGAATPVLVAPPLHWTLEFRCFCLDRKVRTLSPYMRNGQLCEGDGFTWRDDEEGQAREFARLVLQDPRVRTPKAIVLDVGILEGGDWAVVEANAAWGSGVYGCDPNEVLNVIEHATEQV